MCSQIPHCALESRIQIHQTIGQPKLKDAWNEHGVVEKLNLSAGEVQFIWNVLNEIKKHKQEYLNDVASFCSGNGFQHRWCKDFAKDVGKECGLFLNPWDVVRLRTSSTFWNVPGKYGPHRKLLFFFIKKGALCSQRGSAL